ncbi:MAG: hypothetical protein ACODAD_00985 [Planctomycetota bacterium]
MNLPPSIIPIAATALDTVVQRVSQVVRNGPAFSDLFPGSSASPEDARSRRETSEAQAGSGPTELGQHIQRTALRQQFETLRQSVHEHLIEHFDQRGIELAEPAVLEVHPSGQVLEAGGHWDRAKIEHVLQSDAKLQGDVAQLVRLGHALRNPGTADPEAGSAGTARLVVSDNEAFFQVT